MNRYFEITYKKGDKVIFYYDFCGEHDCVNSPILRFMNYTGDYDLRHYGIFERKKSDWEYFKNRLAIVIDENFCYWVNNFITEQPEFVAKYTVNDSQNRLACVYNKTNGEIELHFNDTNDTITLLPRQRKFIYNCPNGEQIVRQFINGHYSILNVA